MKATETADSIGKFNKALSYLIGAVGIFMVIFHMLNANGYILASKQFLNAHLALSFLLVFLGAALSAKKLPVKVVYLILTGLSLACTIYVHINYEALELRAWSNTDIDLIIGVVLIILALIAVKTGFGWFLTIFIICVVLYPLIGKHLPEPLTTRAYPIKQTIANLSIGTTTGLYSGTLRTSAEFIFLFVTFGAVLSATGVQDFFWELGKMLFRKLRSGPGLMAVLNSGLVGSVTGSALANVSITGVYTIPLMKSRGYRSEEAGALEAAASTGGQIMPPVMGIVAFVMASYTGIPYLKIVLMAIIPALLYYLGVGIYAHFITLKKNIACDDIEKSDFFREKVNYRIFWWKLPGFILPLATIILLLVRGLSVMSTAYWAVLCLILISLIRPKDLKPKFIDYIKGGIEGAKSGANLGIILSAIGMVMITFSGSGLAVKLASGIERFSGGTLIGVLGLVWVMCILFGMIGVTSVAYFMGAAFAANVLLNAGLSLEAAHFFLMFPTVFAVVTPPVALACVVASKMANGNYFKTSMETIKAAFAGFFLPFLVAYAPSLILEIGPESSVFYIELGMSLLFILSGQFALIGYFITDMKIIERILLGVIAVSCIFYLSSRLVAVVILILVLFAVFLIMHILRYRSEKKNNSALKTKMS